MTDSQTLNTTRPTKHFIHWLYQTILDLDSPSSCCRPASTQIVMSIISYRTAWYGVAILALHSFSWVQAIQITVKNSCPFTIWPAYAGDTPTAAHGGWQHQANAAPKVIDIPSPWRGGRFWGRTGCDEHASQCAHGGCNGKLEWWVCLRTG